MKLTLERSATHALRALLDVSLVAATLPPPHASAVLALVAATRIRATVDFQPDSRWALLLGALLPPRVAALHQRGGHADCNHISTRRAFGFRGYDTGTHIGGAAYSEAI
jgi:hypothetical protein